MVRGERRGRTFCVGGQVLGVSNGVPWILIRHFGEVKADLLGCPRADGSSKNQRPSFRTETVIYGSGLESAAYK